VDLEKVLRRERVGLYAFTMQGLYATGVAAVALGIARAMVSELITLAFHKAPWGLRLADNAVMQADLAGAKAWLGSASAYLIDTLTMRRPTTWRRSMSPIGPACDSPAPTRSSRAVRSSSASSTCTRFISGSRQHRPFCCGSKVTHTV
jgi:Acyl-CoA dehydrogenase, C-terminal domain